tara:strand:+ start:916 stop:1146 length:231 start_codon:yes stop_codon:yes gene_type:complete
LTFSCIIFSDHISFVGLDLDDDSDLAAIGGVKMGAAQRDAIDPMCGGLLTALFPRLLMAKLGGQHRRAKGTTPTHG